MAVVGSAEIVVRAITTQVKKDIQKAFRDVLPDIQKEGENAGKEFGKSFGNGLNGSLGSEISSAVSNATSAVTPDMRRELGQAGREAGQAAGRAIENGVGNGGKRGGKKAGDNFFSVFNKDLKNAASRLLTFAGFIDILGPGIANLVGGLSSVVSGLFAMGAAAGQAVGALAVLPGLLSLIGQSFLAVKLGLGGVGEAISLGAKAQTAAANASGATAAAAAAAKKGSGSSVAAAKAQQKAQDALTQAQKEAKDAQDALKKAQDAAKDGVDEQTDAERRLADAQNARTNTLSDPNATADTGAAAQKGVDDARAALNAIVADREAANAKLRDAAEKNDAAQAKLAGAQKNRDKAAKDGVKAGGIPVTPAMKAANLYADALAKLTPEAREFVKTILAMRASFKEVGDAVSRELFPPLTKALNLISDSSFFDILKKNLAVTGGLVGQAGLEIAKTFTNDANQGRFANYLKGNNDILAVFTTRTKDGVTPLHALTDLVTKLGLAIQPITKRFVEWASSMLTAYNAGKSVGDFKKFFNRAGDSAAQLGRIFHNLFKAIGILGGAAKPAGQSLLDSFEKSTKKLDNFLQKLRDDGSLEKFFRKASRNFRKISDLIANLGGELLSLGDNPGIGKMADALQPAVDNIGDILDKMTSADAGKAVGDLGTSISELANNLTQTGQLEAFIQTINKIVRGINKIVGAINDVPGANKLFVAFGVFRAVGFAAKIAGFGKSFDKLRSSIFKLVKLPFAALGRKLKGLVPTRFRRAPAVEPTVDPNADPADTTAARTQGEQIGQAIVDGIAEGVKIHAGEIDKILYNTLKAIGTTFEPAFHSRGLDLGENMARGMAQGISTHQNLVGTAAAEMGDEAIDALKKRLGIHSPSVVFQNAGEDTGEGFVLGLRAETDNAYAAGVRIGDAAADGARTGAASARTAAVGAATPVAGPAVGGVSALGGALEESTASAGRSVGVLGKVGGAFKNIGRSASALVGGPFGLILIALPLLIAAFKKLYDSSPAFRKFVDGIVNAVKPVLKIIGTFLINTLNKLFVFINKHMPEIKRIASDVFTTIGGLVKKYVVPAFNQFMDVVKVVFPYVVKAVQIYLKILITYWKTVFNVLKFVIVKIFVPIVKRIIGIVRAVIPQVVKVVKGMANGFRTAFNAVKTVYNKVLKPVFGFLANQVRDKIAIAKKIINGFKDAFQAVGDKLSEIGTSISNTFKDVKDAIKGAFTGLLDAVKKPINSVLQFINDNLIANINNVTSKFGLTIPNIPGFAEGGYTGRGGKYQVAGVVHADEHVIKASSRRAIEKASPGALDVMNRTGRLPVSDGTGGFDIWPGKAPNLGLGKLKDLAGETIGGIKNVGEKIAKEGVGKILGTLVSGAKKGLSGIGVERGPFINDFIYAIFDKMQEAAKTWGGNKGKTDNGTLTPTPTGGVSGAPYTGPPGGWTAPVPTSYPLTQRANAGHNPPNAIDIGTPTGVAVVAATAGVVSSIINKGATSYGLYMKLNHADGLSTLYAHLSSTVATLNQVVKTGQLIAYSGHSGGVRSATGGDGSHLHFEINPSYDTLEELKKRGISYFAKGGVAQATSGGVLSILAEAGKNERVEPLDRDGMSKRDREIMKIMSGQGGRGNTTINVNNPKPERASQSVARAVRSKAVAAGWNA